MVWDLGKKHRAGSAVGCWLVQPPASSCIPRCHRSLGEISFGFGLFFGQISLFLFPHDLACPLMCCSTGYLICNKFAGSQPSLCTRSAPWLGGQCYSRPPPLAMVCNCGLIQPNSTGLRCRAGRCRAGRSHPVVCCHNLF